MADNLTLNSLTLEDLCQQHNGERKNMHCGIHDVVCCKFCASSKHKYCEEVRPVKKAARQQSELIQNLPKLVSKIQTALKVAIQEKKKNKDSVDTTCGKIMATIAELRQNVNDMLDELERETFEQMNKTKDRIFSTIQADIDSCKVLYSSLAKLVDDIHEKQKVDKEAAFVRLKKCEGKMADAELLLQLMVKESYKLEFKPTPRIQGLLASLQGLGVFEIFPSIPPEVEQIYSVADGKEFEVKVRADKAPKCCITGICKLPNGFTIAADNANCKVKLLNFQYIVTSYMELSGAPQDVCQIDHDQVAVSVWLPDRHVVQFITSAHGNLVRRQYIELTHDCCGLACKKQNLYVGSLSAIYLYNLEGQLRKQLYKRKSGNVWRFAVSDDGERIYVTIKGYSLITLDKHGHQLCQLQDRDLAFSTGVAMSGNGTVFVGGLYTCTVIQVDRDGENKLDTLATSWGGVMYPWSLCFDRNTSELIVGQESNQILVMKMKETTAATGRATGQALGDRR